MAKALEKAIPKLPSDAVTWVNTPRGAEARWANHSESMEKLREAAEGVLSRLEQSTNQTFRIGILQSDALHKSYIMSDGENDYVLKFTLPTLPNMKTESEVGMMRWVARKTRLSVPRVYEYKSLGLETYPVEFILMSRPQGEPLAALWRGLDFAAKEDIVRQMAAFVSETFQKQRHLIGGLRVGDGPRGTHRPENYEFSVGSAASPAFVSPHYAIDIFGPFYSAHEWISARIDFALADRRSRLIDATQGSVYYGAVRRRGGPGGFVDDPERLENAIAILKRLGPFISSLFPPGPVLPEPVPPERSMCFHDDLSKQKILVTTETTPVTISVADWSCASAVPPSVACQYPAFLKGRPSNKPPRKAAYRDAATGEPSELYWEHLEMYELTQLRRLFLDEMRRLEPRWVQVFEASQRQRDFDLAISSADDLSKGDILRDWLTDMESGYTNFLSLEDRMG